MIDKREKSILIFTGIAAIIVVGYLIYKWATKQQVLSGQSNKEPWMNKSFSQLTQEDMIAATIYRIKRNPKWFDKVKSKVDPGNPNKKDLTTALYNDARYVIKKQNGWQDTKRWLKNQGIITQ